MSNVFVVEEVPYTYSNCRDLSMYPHLSDVPISPVYPPAKVELLIGQDNSEALVPLQQGFPTFLCLFPKILLGDTRIPLLAFIGQKPKIWRFFCYL